jgi:hypothetical protein
MAECRMWACKTKVFCANVEFIHSLHCYSAQGNEKSGSLLELWEISYLVHGLYVLPPSQITWVFWLEHKY